jgi:hypothetical protein
MVASLTGDKLTVTFACGHAQDMPVTAERPAEFYAGMHQFACPDCYQQATQHAPKCPLCDTQLGTIGDLDSHGGDGPQRMYLCPHCGLTKCRGEGPYIPQLAMDAYPDKVEAALDWDEK